jgi:hypothetical protein
MLEALPHSVWTGSFHVLGVEMKCHVLSDGSRIIESDSVQKLLDAMASPGELEEGDLAAFSRWQRGMD